MNKRKILVTLLILLMVVFTCIKNSYAAGSFSASLTPSNSRVSKGSEVKVTLKLSGINVEDGINALTATLDYDSDVLQLSKSNVKGLNDWSISFNEDNSKLEIDRAETITEDQEIATFTFKVADNTSATSTSIKLKSISAGNSSLDEDVKISDIITNISIGATINPTSSPTASPSSSPSIAPTSTPITPTTQPTATPSGNTVANRATVTPAPGSNTSTTKNEAVPYAGAEGYILPLMLILSVLAIVSFVNYKKIGK